MGLIGDYRKDERAVGTSRSLSGLRMKAGSSDSGAASRQPDNAATRRAQSSSSASEFQRAKETNTVSCSRMGRRKLLAASCDMSCAIGCTPIAAKWGSTA